jgi:septum formation protein
VTVVLASGSPRRRELLERLEMEFQVTPSRVHERPPAVDEDPVSYAVSLAEEKAEEVARKRPGHIVIGADTVVALESTIMGKPADRCDAIRMLESLAGRVHTVVTGVCIRCGGATYSGAVSARVQMRRYTAAEIVEYVDSGEPMDKAGAYAVQGLGGRLVEAIDGCRDTVIGLPLQLVREMLGRCGLTIESL